MTGKALRAGLKARDLLGESVASESRTLGGEVIGGAGSRLQAPLWHVKPASGMGRPSE